MNCFCIIWDSCPCGTGPHVNCRHDKCVTFNFIMTVRVTGSMLQIFGSLSILPLNKPKCGHTDRPMDGRTQPVFKVPSLSSTGRGGTIMHIYNIDFVLKIKISTKIFFLVGGGPQIWLNARGVGVQKIKIIHYHP